MANSVFWLCSLDIILTTYRDSNADKHVLREGADYDGVCLETQPMGGEMYAKRDMEVALNNH